MTAFRSTAICRDIECFCQTTSVFSVSHISATNVAFSGARGVNLHRILRCDTA